MIRSNGLRMVSLRQPFALCLVAALTVAGCDNNPFEHVLVRGKISYEDGTVIPAEGLRLFFKSETPPIDNKTHPRPGVADVNVKDGTFELASTYKYGDGLVSGRHKVVLVIQPETLVPREYTSAMTTTLVIDTADVPLDIKVRRK